MMVVMSIWWLDLAEKKEMEEEEYIDVGEGESFFGGNPDPIGMWATRLNSIGRIPDCDTFSIFLVSSGQREKQTQKQVDKSLVKLLCKRTDQAKADQGQNLAKE